MESLQSEHGPYHDLPICHNNTESCDGELSGDHLAPALCLGGFGDPSWHASGVEAITQTGDHTADYELRHRIRGALESCANDHDTGADENHLSATEASTKISGT